MSIGNSDYRIRNAGISLDVDAGTTVTAKGGTITGSGSADLGTLTLEAGATLTSTGSLTIGTLVLDLDNYTDMSRIYTLVSTTGEGATVSLTNAYTSSINGYTATVNETGTSLTLSFEAVSSTLDVYISMDGTAYDSGMLTLGMVDAHGNKIDVDNVTTYNVAGLYGDADWDDIRALIAGDGLVGITLQGIDGISVVGDGVGNVSFYNAYTGEGNGKDQVDYIPEPATATLSLLALVGLAARRRRMK